jgi:hypothetical protein
MTALLPTPASMTASPDDQGSPRSAVRRRFGRRKFDKQPTQSASVLIATNGLSIPGPVIRRAIQLSEGDAVAVITIARVYGSALGLPNPGLMPSRRELAAQREIVERAVRALEAGGVRAWGQVAATRRPAKTMAAATRARGAGHVLVVRPEPVRWRQIVEGDLVKDVARKLGREYTVEGVAPQ